MITLLTHHYSGVIHNMKKLLLTLLITITATSSFAQSENDKYPKSVGYAESIGMVGAYMNLPEFTSSKYSNGQPRGGAMVYFNLFNEIWGNVAFGINAEYRSVEHKHDSNGYNFDAKLDMLPTSVNVAYMTASDLVNAWAGIGFTYATYSYKVDSGTLTNGATTTNYSSQGSDSGSVYGFDAFVGAEYMFTESGNLGIFLEFRYSMLGDVKVSNDILGTSVNQEIPLDNFRYALGISYHF